MACIANKKQFRANFCASFLEKGPKLHEATNSNSMAKSHLSLSIHVCVCVYGICILTLLEPVTTGIKYIYTTH